MFDLLDQVCAEVLGIPVQEYISKIETLSGHRATIIIGYLLDEPNEVKERQLKRIFKSIN